MKKFLHVGCGSMTKTHTTRGFSGDDWQEVRFDIDPQCKPDIIGTIVDMTGVATGSMDALFSAHNIEHVFPHEVVPTLKEFRRVLTDDGFVILTCPDLQSVCQAVASKGLLDPLYLSSAGPIAPIDVLYGFRQDVAAGKHYMAHKGGFTWRSLEQSFFDAEFGSWIGGARPSHFDLWIAAFKTETAMPEMESVARDHIP
jgi:hypothetical protein